MDPISVSHLVQDRTDELQRTADQVRLERSLRSKLAAAAALVGREETPRQAQAVPRSATADPAQVVPRVQPASIEPARPVEAPPSPGTAAGCTSAEHAA